VIHAGRSIFPQTAIASPIRGLAAARIEDLPQCQSRFCRNLNLGSAATGAIVRNDPVGFVRGLEGAVMIDEVQRVPELLLAIKRSVDLDPRPGRFLLTGSTKYDT